MSRKEVTFENLENAFSSKDDRALKRSLWLFRLMERPLMVKFFAKLTLLAIKLRLPVSPAIKATIFRQFCGGESLEESKRVVGTLKRFHIGSILDYSVEGKENEKDFERTKREIIRIIRMAKGDAAIPYTSVKLSGIMPARLLEKISAGEPLSPEQGEALRRAKFRVSEIVMEAVSANLAVYVDAEESWIQDAIDRITEEMMRKYNRKRAIVLTTLQMYRWDRMEYLGKMIHDARQGNYFIGVKLVRGAYLEKENARAKGKGYRSPIHASKLATDQDFDKAVKLCLRNISVVTLCAGTHNEASTLYLIHAMKEMGIDNDDPRVCFSQLYGMSDHITFNLADAGYNVTKYLPYGPVKSVVPYLIRRANENTAIAGQMSRELRLILAEKERRAHSRMLAAKPVA
jgi:proline dehydrogenase